MPADRRKRAPARSTSRGARRGIRAGTRPAGGTADNRAALRPSALATDLRVGAATPGPLTVRPRRSRRAFFFGPPRLTPIDCAPARFAQDERLAQANHLYAIA